MADAATGSSGGGGGGGGAVEVAASAATLDVLELPVIDLDIFKASPESEEAKEECRKAARGLHEFGLLVVRSSTATQEDNSRFIDLIEQYFEQPTEVKMKDVRSQFSYQVGATPDHTELPRNHCKFMDSFADEDKPVSACPPELDPKWRYFWRIGARPASTKHPELNVEAVVPEGFPTWTEVLNTWGEKMMSTVRGVASMAAVGFDLPASTFTDLLENGPHLLAPTASDFSKHGALGTVLAGFHYDLNFMTIHGKSRYPGLLAWTRGGKKVRVAVPDGCLLVQAGKQFEYLTAGHVLAGYHEVVVIPATVEAIEAAKAASRSLWRISSTLFSHVASDNVLRPIGHFAEGADPEKYAPIDAGDQVRKELEIIKLGTRPAEARAEATSA